ncbi:hypothetical protein [Nostoc spongiaeforme]|nr:hypothetical protein [Nostoc spongiaeforme]
MKSKRSKMRSPDCGSSHQAIAFVLFLTFNLIVRVWRELPDKGTVA